MHHSRLREIGTQANSFTCELNGRSSGSMPGSLRAMSIVIKATCRLQQLAAALTAVHQVPPLSVQCAAAVVPAGPQDCSTAKGPWSAFVPLDEGFELSMSLDELRELPCLQTAAGTTDDYDICKKGLATLSETNQIFVSADTMNAHT